MRVGRERLRKLDEEMAAAAGFDPPRPPPDVYLRDAFEHPECGLYDTLDCPGGSKVVLIREFPGDGRRGPVWFHLLPIGPRAESLPYKLLVGTPEEVHEWYAAALALLAGDGWRIAGAPSAETEVLYVQEQGRPLS